MDFRLITFLLLSPVFGVPVGFTTYFQGYICPDGWTDVAETRGRLIVSVSNASYSGIKVGDALVDKEDRIHHHAISGSVYFNSKSVAASSVGGKFQSTCHGEQYFTSESDNATSGIAYVQLLMCTFTDSTKGDLPVPYGTIGFFLSNVTDCGGYGKWGDMVVADGRVIIPGQQSQFVVSVTPRLTSGEITSHRHFYSNIFTPNDQSISTVTGCCNGNPAARDNYNVSGYTADSSDNVPYLQMLTCVSQNTTFDSALPDNAFFFTMFKCPTGYIGYQRYQGRFIVSLVVNGTRGEVFGGTPIPSGSPEGSGHKHDFYFYIYPNGCKLAVVGGGGADGFMKHQDYYRLMTTEYTNVSMPYVSIPFCQPIQTSVDK